MKVALDISPISSGHSIRGIGSYTSNLRDSLKQLRGLELEEFSIASKPPQADVVHYPYFDLFFHTLPIKRSTKRVVTIHDVIPLMFPSFFPSGLKGNINLLLQKLALSRTNVVICDSNTSKKDISSKLNFSQDKIKVIYLAAGKSFKQIENKSSLEKTQKKFNLPDIFFLYVGDVNWNKNTSGLIKAVKTANVQLVMVGKSLTDNNIPQTKELEGLIKSQGVENLVSKLGFVQESDLINIYNLAAATISPSFYEGFGLPVMESMACGTPIICSNNSSLSEITDKKLTFYCNPSNPNDIAAKIEEVGKLKNSAREDLSKALIKHASAYTWDKVAKQTFEAYKDL